MPTHNGARTSAKSSEKPNIVFLLTDSLRRDHSVHGATPWGMHPPLHLPTMWQLTRRGTAFEHAYAAAPLCAPSRQTLYQGRNYAAARPAIQACHMNQAGCRPCRFTADLPSLCSSPRRNYCVSPSVPKSPHRWSERVHMDHAQHASLARCLYTTPAKKLNFWSGMFRTNMWMTDSFVEWLNRPEQQFATETVWRLCEYFAARASHWPTGDHRVNAFGVGLTVRLSIN